MNDLLTTAIGAHGGRDRWQNLSKAAYGADNHPHLGRILVPIDFHEITLE
jgi:hypothetical protein